MSATVPSRLSCVELSTGVERDLAQGLGIWGLFKLPSGRRPEELYSHPVSENLEFSVVATCIAGEQTLSLTFR